MAIPFIKHTPVGKSTQEQPYTASAHLRYISRKRNTHHIEADGMPSHYWAAQDWLDKREDSIRKNGRVCDKLIIALPNEMTLEQGVETVRRFGNKLCKYDEDQQRFLRGSYYFTLQDHGTKNFHCHFMYVDADRETGERVLETSGKGSSERIKRIWEDACNEKLMEYEIGAQISFEQASKDREPLSTVTEVEQPEPQEPDAALEAPMDMNQQFIDETYPPIIPQEDLIAGALALDESKRWLRNKQHDIIRLTDEAERAQADAITFQKEAARFDIKADHHRNVVDLVRDELSPLTREDGSLKGFEVSLFGRKWTSPKRAKAQSLEGEIALHSYYQQDARETADRRLAEAEAYAEAARSKIEKAEATKRELEATVATYGEEATIEDTLQVIDDGIQQNLSTLSPDDICALHENGAISAEQAIRALELMGQEAYIARIELRDRQEMRQEAEIDDERDV